MAQEDLNPFEGLKLDTAQLREVAVEADADPRSVKKRIEGKYIKGMSGQRIDKVLQKLFPEYTPMPTSIPHNGFVITLALIPDCRESVDAGNVHKWLKDVFEGTDMGVVSILRVEKRT